MGQILYLECETGISGDMVVAALLDLGADESKLRAVLESLNVDGFDIKISRVNKAGIDACDFDVITGREYDNHDHDMEYLYSHMHKLHPVDDIVSKESQTYDGYNEDHDNANIASSDAKEEHIEANNTRSYTTIGLTGGYVREHHHDDTHHHHHHAHRGLKDVIDIVDGADMSEGAKRLARRIFEILARAEAGAHGTTVEKVHFHEVGAIDSVVDIISAAVCVDDLGIDEVVISPLTEGKGSIRCAHGILPVPVPAVAQIISTYGLVMSQTDMIGELVTPTGAAIAAALRSRESLPVQYRAHRIGIGAGKRAYERPAMVRAMLIEDAKQASDKLVCKIETDIDDSTGEVLGHVIDLLYEQGAKEVHYTPIYMKKNRPGVELSIICAGDRVTAIENIIFTETTTIGIRKQWMERTVLPRTQAEIKTPIGELKVKKVTLPDGSFRTYPEYESLKSLARANHIPVIEAMEITAKACEDLSKQLEA